MFTKPRTFRRLLFALLPLALAFNANAQTAKTPLTHETMWLLKRVGAPVPSPDGKWVVFSMVEPAYDEKDQVSDLWIVPSDGSAKPRRLTFTKGGESGVAWSPDSRQIVFSARREGDEVSQLYVLNVAMGGEAVRVTSLSTGARSAQWRPDGKALLFVSSVYPPVHSTTRGTRRSPLNARRKSIARAFTTSFPFATGTNGSTTCRRTCSCKALSPARKRKICWRERSSSTSVVSPVAARIPPTSLTLCGHPKATRSSSSQARTATRPLMQTQTRRCSGFQQTAASPCV